VSSLPPPLICPFGSQILTWPPLFQPKTFQQDTLAPFPIWDQETRWGLQELSLLVPMQMPDEPQNPLSPMVMLRISSQHIQVHNSSGIRVASVSRLFPSLTGWYSSSSAFSRAGRWELSSLFALLLLNRLRLQDLLIEEKSWERVVQGRSFIAVGRGSPARSFLV